jgi:uncharacterized protein (TIGR01777 family)
METPDPLKIGITGVTGFLGSRVAEIAARAGHHVTGFSRNASNQVSACDEMREFAPGLIDLSGLDVIIHLAGESIFGFWTPRKKEKILASRRDGTRMLVDAMMAARQAGHGPSTLVTASAIGFYGDLGETEADESTPQGHDFLAEVCKIWEGEALRAEQAGVRVAILRFGIILGREGGMLGKLRPLFLLGLGAKLGDGKQWVSWIHAGDAANLALLCATDPKAKGVYNAVAPKPVRSDAFSDAIAQKWHRKARIRIPAFAIKAGLGEFGQMLLTSQRVKSRRSAELGYEFHYPQL